MKHQIAHLSAQELIIGNKALAVRHYIRCPLPTIGQRRIDKSMHQHSGIVHRIIFMANWEQTR